MQTLILQLSIIIDEESKANNATNERSMRAFISKIPLSLEDIDDCNGPHKSTKIDQKVKIQAICILSRGKESGTEKITSFRLFVFQSNFSINHLRNIEEKILHTIINKADCFLLRSNDPNEYIKLVKNSFS